MQELVQELVQEIGLVEVALPCPLNQTFTYLAPLNLPVGIRVQVPFGPRQVVGVLLSSRPQEAGQTYALKSIKEALDSQPLFDATLLTLGRWMSSYYQHPIGEVFNAMLPAAAKVKPEQSLTLSDKGKDLCSAGHKGTEEKQELAAVLTFLFSRRATLRKATLQTKLQQYYQQKPAVFVPLRYSLADLRKRKLLTLSPEREQGLGQELGTNSGTKERKAPATTAFVPLLERGEAEPELSQGQSLVLEALVIAAKQASRPTSSGAASSGSTGPKPCLLWGVTGSGKTEIYLHLIARLATDLARPGERANPQALVLVPEIALTPQMTAVFSRRFPGHIGVVHSAMSAKERWRQHELCRTGQLKVLIGARSAIFAPFCNLALIIVDEEHDGSYKQQGQFSYHARDVAVLRANLAGIPLVLGSATPSLESYVNAQRQRYTLARLQERVLGRPLPEVTIIEAKVDQLGVRLDTAALSQTRTEQTKAEQTRGRTASSDPSLKEPSLSSSVPIAPAVLTALRDTVLAGGQAIVLVNRRGYAYYLYDTVTKKVSECPACSISLTLHKKGLTLLCHHCGYSVRMATLVRDQPSAKFFAIGQGSQKVEEYLGEHLAEARIGRLDADTASTSSHLTDTLQLFREGSLDILVGTQMLAKGHDFPKVTLTVLLDVDRMLHLPDFRAGERTFQLLVQAAGRSGRGQEPGRVLIQTVEGQNPLIQAAVQHDFEAFATRELRFRQAHAYPPFGKLILWVLSSRDLTLLSSYCHQLELKLASVARVQPQLLEGVKVLGPQIPPLEKIAHRYRRVVLFSALQASLLHRLQHHLRAELPPLKGDLRLHLDVDPQSLL